MTIILKPFTLVCLLLTGVGGTALADIALYPVFVLGVPGPGGLVP